MPYDITAIGELLIDFATKGSNDAGYPVMEANPGGAPCNVLALLARGAYALSSGDSLVSLRYLREVFMPGAVEQGSTAANSTLRETYGAAKSTQAELQAG